MKVQATVDLPSVKKVDEQIRALEKNISKLKVSGQFDDSALKNLTNQLNALKVNIGTIAFSSTALNELTTQVEKALSNINISSVNIGNVGNGAKQTGQQIGTEISQGITQGMSSASKTTEKVLRDFSELNDAKRKFVDGHDLISKDDIVDAEKLYDTVRKAFSEFGQVTVSKGSMNDGSLENMRVKIEQVNGEMKITRDFMLYFNENRNGFKLVDDDTIRTTEKMVQHLNEEKNIVNATNEEANAIKAKLAEQEKYYKNIKNEVNNLYNLKTKLLSADELQTAELEKQIKQTKERISYNNKQIDKKDLRDNSLDRQINDLEVAKQKQLDLASAKSQDTVNTKELAQAEKEATAALKERQSLEAQVNKIQLLSNGGIKNDYATQLAVLEGRFSKLGLQETEIAAKTKKVNESFDNLKKRLSQPFDEKNFQEIINLNNNLQKELIESQNELTRLSASIKMATDSSRLNNVTQMQKWADNNGKAMKKWGTEINDIIAKMGDLTVPMPKLESDQLLNSFKKIKNEAIETGNVGMTTAQKFKNAWDKIGGWSLVTGAFTKLIHTGRQMYDAVYDIDTAMTNLYKVTDETSQKYNQFLESSSKSVHELGRSISSLVDQTANWAKLGFSLDEAEQLAKISSVYANVGEVNDDTAVSDLVTAMKAFNIEATDSITIVDSLNKLGNEFATDAASLGEGLSKSASALHLAGNDINETLAMLTGGTEITQNASEMGNALKVLSMRIRGMKGQLEDLGEEYENVESISKIQTQILNQTHGHVNIFDDNGDFKSTYEILKGIAEVYDHISQTDQAALLETIAGKQRGNQIAALIQAFQSGQIEKAYEASANAAGSAMQEQERWLESLEAKTQQFEAVFQKLSQTVLNSNLVKFFVDLGISGVSALDAIIDKLGSLGTIGLGAGLFAGVKNIGKCRISVRIS